MMETMIPPQVGMRLRTKNNNKKEAKKMRRPKKERPKKEKAKKTKQREKKREGTMLLSFFHTYASK